MIGGQPDKLEIKDVESAKEVDSTSGQKWPDENATTQVQKYDPSGDPQIGGLKLNGENSGKEIYAGAFINERAEVQTDTDILITGEKIWGRLQ